MHPARVAKISITALALMTQQRVGLVIGTFLHGLDLRRDVAGAADGFATATVAVDRPRYGEANLGLLAVPGGRHDPRGIVGVAATFIDGASGSISTAAYSATLAPRDLGPLSPHGGRATPIGVGAADEALSNLSGA